jgi:hypothetical protein
MKATSTLVPIQELESSCLVELVEMFPNTEPAILREAILVAQKSAYRELNSISMGQVYALTTRLKDTEDRLHTLMNERRARQQGTECHCPDCACGP